MKIYRHYVVSEELIDNIGSTDNKLYHVTKIDKAVSILKTDTFKPGPWKNLSMSTIENFNLNAQNACFVLSSNKLKKDFELISYDTNSGSDGVDSENEIRIQLNSDINQFSKYVEELRLKVSDKLFNMVLRHYSIKLEDIEELCKLRGISLVKL